MVGKQNNDNYFLTDCRHCTNVEYVFVSHRRHFVPPMCYFVPFVVVDTNKKSCFSRAGLFVINF